MVAHVAKLSVFEFDAGLFNTEKDLCIVSPGEGEMPRQKNVHDHPKAPTVAFKTVFSLEHFWGDIVASANNSCQLALFAAVI